MEAINSLMSVQGRFQQPNELQTNLAFPAFMILELRIRDRALYKDAAIQNDAVKKKNHTLATSVWAEKEINAIL